jgi:hypothetical protein
MSGALAPLHPGYGSAAASGAGHESRNQRANFSRNAAFATFRPSCLESPPSRGP